MLSLLLLLLLLLFAVVVGGALQHPHNDSVGADIDFHSLAATLVSLDSGLESRCLSQSGADS